MVFNETFSKMSVISSWSVLLVEYPYDHGHDGLVEGGGGGGGGGYVRLIKRRSHEPLVITSDVRDEHHKTAISHRDLIVAIVKYILFS